jgi:uncharacterized protein YndB with AHSA1/START domain
MKWFLRIVAALVVLVLIAGYVGYRKLREFTAAGGTARVAILAPRERVFATLGNADSVAAWMGGRPGGVEAGGHGALQPGDSIIVESDPDSRNRHYRLVWTVTAVRPNELMAMNLRPDTSRMVIAARRDSLFTVGDSTIIVSTMTSPMFDSVQTAARDSAKRGASAMIAFGSSMAIAVFRVQAERELARLKAHVERR